MNISLKLLVKNYFQAESVLIMRPRTQKILAKYYFRAKNLVDILKLV